MLLHHLINFNDFGFKKKKRVVLINFILFLAALDLHCCSGLSLVAASGALLFIVVLGLLTVVSSLVVEHKFYAHGLKYLQHAGAQ